jgi:hypothetical protein
MLGQPDHAYAPMQCDAQPIKVSEINFSVECISHTYNNADMTTMMRNIK